MFYPVAGSLQREIQMMPDAERLAKIVEIEDEIQFWLDQ